MKYSHAPEELSTSAERIVEIATALFSEHGYHGVSTREIAAATGLSVATVHHHVGAKHDLYVKVYKGLLSDLESFFNEVMEVVSTADVSDPSVRSELPSRLIDKFIHQIAEHPVRARLFLRHWLDSAEEFNAIEAELSLPLYRKVYEVLNAAKEAGIIQLQVDPGLFIRSFEWLAYGYFVSGGFDWEHWRSDPYENGQLTAFKTYLKEYLWRMLGF